MSAEYIDGWYLSANQYDVGPSSGTPTGYQIHNAGLIYDAMSAEGWTVNAIAGMIGNIMYESSLDPACAHPLIGGNLASIGNDTASQYPDNAYGLLQWYGRGTVDPANNQLVGYAIRHGYQWYYGGIQLERLLWEYQNNQKFHAQTVDGVYWTFQKYAQSGSSPDTLAKVWMMCYEGTSSVLDIRKANARNWYNILSDSPDVPANWITGDVFASYALSYDGRYIPYSECDCIDFINLVWHDIPDVPSNILLGNVNGYYGTNTLWRSSRTFDTYDPFGNHPTTELWYKNTIAGCVVEFNEIPTGSLLFHKISNEGPPAIPPQYANDGIGNFAHVGIYVGNQKVMQSGGRDASSVPGGGVHLSNYDPTAWSHIAFPVYVDPLASSPEPPEPPGQSILTELLLWYTNKPKGVNKNVRWKF